MHVRSLYIIHYSLFTIFLVFTFSAYSQSKKLVLLPIVENGKWGFINKEGKVIVTPQYDQAGEFNGQLATTMRDGLVYILDSTGQQLFQEGYEDVQLLGNGWIAIKKEKYALADATGFIHTPFLYQQVVDKKLNTISLRLDTLQYKLFHSKTKKTSEEIYSEINVFPERHYILTRKEKLVALLDSMHVVRMPLSKGTSASMMNGVPVLNTGNGFLFFDQKGTVANDSCTWKEYEIYSPFFIEVWNIASQKFILTTENGKLTPFQGFISVDPFTDLLLKLNKNDKTGLLDKNGTIVLTPDYEKIEERQDEMIFILKEGKCGLLSPEGKTLFKAHFDFIEKFDHNGIAVASLNNMIGLVHKNGKTLVPFKYHNIEVAEESWKCYANGGMDQYLLSNPVTVEEVLNFKNVGSISVGPRTSSRDYNFKKRTLQFATRGVYRKSKSGNYLLTYRLETYEPSAKIKCLISKNHLNVERLFGAYSVPEKLTLASKEYWDIQIEEFDENDCARIILPGDRQALLFKTGAIKNMLPSLKNGKYQPQAITYVGPFRSGLARVNIGGYFANGDDINDPGRETFSRHKLSCYSGKWGYINGKGEVVIKINLEYVSDFCNGKAIIKKDGKYGVIDSLNNIVIKPEYDLIEYLENSDNKFFKLTRTRSEWGILNTSGEIILKAEYEKTGGIHNNRIPVCKGGLWGAVNYQGELLVPCRYAQLNSFSEGKAAFKEKFRWGIIDSLGNVIKEPSFHEVYSYQGGLAAARFDSKWGFINEKGDWVIQPQYSNVKNFQNGIAAVYLKKKWWYIDRSGKKFSHGTFTDAGSFNQNEIAIVKKGKKYLLVRKSDGATIKHCEYSFIAPFSEGYARVKSKKNRFGFIDTLGRLVVPAVYTNAGSFSEGLARVRISTGKWGYIRPDNSIAIEPQFMKCEDFSEGKATVVLVRNTAVVDAKGTVLFTLPESTMGRYSEGLLLIKGNYYNENGKVQLSAGKGTDFKNGLAKINIFQEKRSMESFVNRKNIRLATYDHISNPNDDRATFMISRRFGLASDDGKIISDPTFQKMLYLGEGIFQIQLFDAIGYLRQDGKWLWEPRR